MVYYTIIYNIGNNFRLQEAFLQPLLGWSSLKTSRPKNLLFLLAHGQEKGGIAETEDRIPTYKICRQVADGIFSKETSILCYEEHVANQSASLALINSRLRRATLAMVSFLGHTASQARVLVQLPKPSSSILATIALARLAASTRP